MQNANLKTKALLRAEAGSAGDLDSAESFGILPLRYAPRQDDALNYAQRQDDTLNSAQRQDDTLNSVWLNPDRRKS
jgi:hypothetical protein